jgi:hypothetical protein
MLPVPLGNRIRLVTCRSSARQAAWVYSLISPRRTGFRRIRSLSTSGHGGAGSIRFVVGDSLGYALVRPGRVVVHLIPGQDGVQVCRAEDQHAVEDLAAQGADKAFAGRVAPHRQLHPFQMIDTVRYG